MSVTKPAGRFFQELVTRNHIDSRTTCGGSKAQGTARGTRHCTKPPVGGRGGLASGRSTLHLGSRGPIYRGAVLVGRDLAGAVRNLLLSKRQGVLADVARSLAAGKRGSHLPMLARAWRG